MNTKFKTYLKNSSLAILAALVYFILPEFQALPFELFNVSVDSIPNFIKIVYLTIYNILILMIILFIFKDTLINNFKDIKKNHKIYFKENLKYWLIGLIIMMISNVIISLILNQDLSNNEEAIRSLFKENPIYVYISAVIFAPIIEELIFRQGIKFIVPYKYLFIFISGFIFGGLHVISSLDSTINLLYLIPYCSLGFAFAYILYKTNNIFVTIAIHTMHNGILMSLQFLLLIFS